METEVYLDGNLSLAFNKQKIWHFPEETRILFWIETITYDKDIFYSHLFYRINR